jgi:predicted transglutaminase-like cysteine proteinase
LQGCIWAGAVALAIVLIGHETAAARPNPGRPQPSEAAEPFHQSTLRAPEGALWSKWRQLQSDAAADLELVAQCRADLIDCYSAPALRFIELVELAQTRTGRDRLDLVNRAVNSAIRYSTDLVQHGVIDLWSSPLASLASGRGDCEDYAIAKYFVLRSAGVAASDLRIVLVRDLDTREYHAVVAARQDTDWLVLDNRRMTLLDGDAIQRLQLLFTVDSQGVQMFGTHVANGIRITPATNR